MNNITINNETNLIEIIQSDSQILTIVKVEPVSLNIIDIGLQGVAGAKGDKGDKGDSLQYSDLTQQQKQEFANLVELDSSQLVTDLQAIYILNRE